MEDGVKGEPARPTEVQFLSKAGWVKKATGKVLAGYKRRYVHVEKTEVVVYEDEDLKNCLERFDLENFDKCLELKSVLMKKNRLILIRSPKCAIKIHDVKIQVQTVEEKNAWIKALSEGISRAKNKIFDEVTVDESNNLDHVTRTRPKGNRSRRPPTRIHMKEVANVSSEGNLRLDLDVPDARLSNGNHYVNMDFEDPPQDIVTPPSPPSSTSSYDQEETQTVVEPNPEKKIIKPPMPPSKQKGVSANENGPSMQDDPEKVPGPPKLPSKEQKPSLLRAGENIMGLSEGVPVAGASEKTDPPMNPPTKPMSSSTEILADALLPVQEPRPPTIPPADKKPRKEPEPKGSPVPLEAISDEITEEVSEMDPSLTLPTASFKQPEAEGISESHIVAEHPEISDSTPSGPANTVPSSSKSQEKGLSKTTAAQPSQDSLSLESTKMKPSPLLLVKKKPLPCPPKHRSPVKQSQPKDPPTGNTDPTITQHEDSPSSGSKLETTSVPSVCSTDKAKTPRPIIESHYDVPRLVLTLGETVAVKPDLSQPDCGFPAEETEDKSRDSICQSDADSMDSGSEETLTSSTFALRGSQVGLDSFYTSEDDGEDYNKPEQVRDEAPPGPTLSQVTSSLQVNLMRAQPPKPRPPIPCKPMAKTISSSVGDLLSDVEETEKRPQFRDLSKRDSGDGVIRVKILERAIALGLEQTKELLSCTSQTQGEGLGKNVPEDLLAKAMDKLRMADQFLREAKNFEESKRLTSKNHRNSW